MAPYQPVRYATSIVDLKLSARHLTRILFLKLTVKYLNPHFRSKMQFIQSAFAERKYRTGSAQVSGQTTAKEKHM